MADNLRKLLNIKHNLESLLGGEYTKDEIVLISKIVDELRGMTDRLMVKAGLREEDNEPLPGKEG